MRLLACWIPIGALLACGSLHAERIFWFSPPGATNHTSIAGALMDGGYRFELGVFDGSFEPTSDNKGQWAQHWRPAQRIGYNAVGKDFSAEFVVEDNDPPFTVGKRAYIWGFRGDAVSGEWILFTDDSWNWPFANTTGIPNPLPPAWSAADATPILGEINSSGSPFLMKSAAVTQAPPPDTTWDQFQAEIPSEEPLKGPNDDPDQDGIPNLLEFVFGTAPSVASAPVSTPVSLDSSHLVISIPRRIDHKTTLTVEVSGNLVDWNSGPSHTQILADDAGELLVRDRTPLDPAHPKRFIRLKASLP